MATSRCVSRAELCVCVCVSWRVSCEQAQLGGKTGLVPQNFVRDLQSPDQSHDQLPGEEDVGIEVFAADTESMKEAQKIFNVRVGAVMAVMYAVCVQGSV